MKELTDTRLEKAMIDLKTIAKLYTKDREAVVHYFSKGHGQSLYNDLIHIKKEYKVSKNVHTMYAAMITAADSLREVEENRYNGEHSVVFKEFKDAVFSNIIGEEIE